jgi:hypothetical protein
MAHVFVWALIFEISIHRMLRYPLMASASYVGQPTIANGDEEELSEEEEEEESPKTGTGRSPRRPGGGEARTSPDTRMTRLAATSLAELRKKS